MRAWITPSSRLHQVPAGFPEIHERLEWAETACLEAGIPVERPSAECLAQVPAAAAIDAVHLDGRMSRLREAAIPWRARIDTSDCPVSAGTPEAAMASVQTTLLALRQVIQEANAAQPPVAASGFVLARPPGHHATPRHAMGFCYCNNVAIAARESRRMGLARVFILDIDVHHGNGTQEIFYSDPEVFVCSLHEDPRVQYPGTGFSDERGTGPGLGATLNLPLASGTAGAEYLRAFRDSVIPALEAHPWDLLLISAGFDTHVADPLGGLALRGPDYRQMGVELKSLPVLRRVPTLMVLEGGYSPLCFSDGLRPFLEGWLGGN
jgi:acetoin utilization deacetylase AcuC-like enzyme